MVKKVSVTNRTDSQIKVLFLLILLSSLKAVGRARKIPVPRIKIEA
jgi:hypothetical protein